MLKRFLVVFSISLFSFAAASANKGDKENEPSSTLKKKKSQDTTPPSSPSKNVFQTPERRYWDPVKRKLVMKGSGSMFPPDSPEVRSIYRQIDLGKFFTDKTEFQGKTVFQSDKLFDINDKALNKEGEWETNLQRMQQGVSPIGHKGACKDSLLPSLCDTEKTALLKTQKLYRIELQHVMQKDTGLPEDPICEMTHDAHMGTDTRHIVEKDMQGKIIRLIASSLKKEAANAYLEDHPEHQMVTNILHFRRGKSLINREEFGLWRIAYWKAWAHESEILVRTSQKRPALRQLFLQPTSALR